MATCATDKTALNDQTDCAGRKEPREPSQLIAALPKMIFQRAGDQSEFSYVLRPSTHPQDEPLTQNKYDKLAQVGHSHNAVYFYPLRI